MQELIELLKDGKSRSVTMIAAELHKSVSQVERDIEFLEKTCLGCMPEGGFKNMGVMWEII